MLAKERQNAIVEEVNLNGSVLVKELAEKYKVTEDSIRKDLTLLQKKGLLKKTYGGAVKNREKMHDLYVAQRIGKNTEDKRSIAQKALNVIDDGDMIFLDSSTSNIELAKLLIQTHKPVKVVTSMIEIMLLYTNVHNPQFIFIGGMLSDERDQFVGDITNNEISHYHFDKAFIGTVGVDLDENSVYNHSVKGSITKRTIMENSEHSYILLETRKLALTGNYKIGDVTDFTGAFLDKEPNDKLKRQMNKINIEWYY